MTSEAFSRVSIDKELEFSGWNLLNPKEVRFELPGSNGRADYVLSGQRGPLGVLEAKKEDVDPYDAKEQARGYAENLKAPFVILSNGLEHFMRISNFQLGSINLANAVYVSQQTAERYKY